MEKTTDSTPTHQPLQEKKMRTQTVGEIREKEEGVPGQERREKKDDNLGFCSSHAEVSKRGRPRKSTSSSRKPKSHTSAPIWAENWLLRKKERKDGRIDKFYIHKVIPNLTCRSLKEVQRYEDNGTLPRTKTKASIKGKQKEMHGVEEQMDVEENENSLSSDSGGSSEPASHV